LGMTSHSIRPQRPSACSFAVLWKPFRYWSFGVLLLMTLASREVRSQTRSGTYLIYSFEDTYKTSQHGTTTYYWLQPLDSVQSGPAALSVFYQSGFSTNVLAKCENGTAFDPFVIHQDESYQFDRKHYATADTLERLIYKGRKKIQTITKRWPAGQRETVEVFVTPIAGRFCSAPFSPGGPHGFGYRGLIFLPVSHFKARPGFWSDPRSTDVLTSDYSRVHFSILPRL
jgi:hypothetical protein